MIEWLVLSRVLRLRRKRNRIEFCKQLIGGLGRGTGAASKNGRDQTVCQRVLGLLTLACAICDCVVQDVVAFVLQVLGEALQELDVSRVSVFGLRRVGLRGGRSEREAAIGIDARTSRVPEHAGNFEGFMDSYTQFLSRLIVDTESQVMRLKYGTYRIFASTPGKEPIKRTTDQIAILRRHVLELEGNSRKRRSNT
jgi:hypothetical protein